MKFNTTFTITAICNHFLETEVQDNIIKDKGIKLNIEITKEQASNFLFRFAPPIFVIKDYKVILRFDELNVLKAIVLVKENNFYIVLNTNQVISDIMEGYIRLRTSEKVLSIMEFDFETSLEDEDGIVDEFDLKE